jgi:hypothetical protein
MCNRVSFPLFVAYFRDKKRWFKPRLQVEPKPSQAEPSLTAWAEGQEAKARPSPSRAKISLITNHIE